jgi:glycogen debranching enzyme
VTANVPRDLLIGDDYYILASSVAADLPKLVLKHDEAFVVADRHGDLPNLPRSELGFYIEGTRFLRQLELIMLGERPLVLYADVSEDALQASVELTNPDVAISPRVILAGRSVRISRRLCVCDRALYQIAAIESFTREPLDLVLTFRFTADFVDMFEVRGLRRERRGTLLPPEFDSTEVRLAYRGLDDVVRTTSLLFDPAPAMLGSDVAEYQLSLGPRERLQVALTVSALSHARQAARPSGLAEALPRPNRLARAARNDRAFSPRPLRSLGRSLAARSASARHRNARRVHALCGRTLVRGALRPRRHHHLPPDVAL